MSKPHYILDEPLPKSQDFSALKEEGLEYIQATSGSVWTNLNASDPGVTILDQVCFALTELGYCNDFPVHDILTKENGKLPVHDQFYLPDEILTTSPVTINDYRKYVIDGVDGVNNAIILPVSGCYKTYLLIDPTVTDAAIISGICMAAFYHLNKRRNLGELFLTPVALTPDPHYLYGRIEIQKQAMLNEVLSAIETKVAAYIFPPVVQTGYQQLMRNGEDVNRIFDGPMLQKGWIDTDSLGNKRDVLRLTELVQLIGSTPGVTAITSLTFDNTAPGIKEIKSDIEKLLTVNVAASVANGYLEVYSKGTRLQLKNSTGFLFLNNAPGEPEMNTVFGSQPDLHADIPKGKFRDINTYYSIQNTFPEIFGVGLHSLENAATFQVAQSRQLKGYLLLFDQLLANQFSQLANVGNLFSFKNSKTGTPLDKAAYYAVQNKLQPKRRQYPVPYRAFSPTYFYQSLYDIPHIRPLLKGHDTFNFSVGIESPKELEHKSWKAYKEDPYNPYMQGMMQFMEDEETSISRRNDILDHLLARHGESPLMIDSIIEGSMYSGDALKDKVILKSLYLQNLGLLSYFRNKAYNFIGADKLCTDILEVPGKFEEFILTGNSADFIFSSGKINEAEKLIEHDFHNYSGIELKLSLLFGFKMIYNDFIVANYHTTANQEVLLAYWLITQRRGLILIETALLLQHAVKEESILLNNGILSNKIIVVMPAFIPSINNPEFISRLNFFLQQTLPLNITFACLFVNSHQLFLLQEEFVPWYNRLVCVYNDDHPGVYTPVVDPAPLITLLIEISSSANA